MGLRQRGPVLPRPLPPPRRSQAGPLRSAPPPLWARRGAAAAEAAAVVAAANRRPPPPSPSAARPGPPPSLASKWRQLISGGSSGASSAGQQRPLPARPPRRAARRRGQGTARQGKEGGSLHATPTRRAPASPPSAPEPALSPRKPLPGGGWGPRPEGRLPPTQESRNRRTRATAAKDNVPWAPAGASPPSGQGSQQAQP